MGDNTNGFPPSWWPDRRTAARYLKTSRESVKRWGKQGRLEVKKDAKGVVRFSLAELDRYARENGIEPDNTVREEIEKQAPPPPPETEKGSDAQPIGTGEDTPSANREDEAKPSDRPPSVVLAFGLFTDIFAKEDEVEYADLVRRTVCALGISPEEAQEHIKNWFSPGGRFVVAGADCERLLGGPVKTANDLFTRTKTWTQAAIQRGNDLKESGIRTGQLEGDLQKKTTQIAELEDDLEQARTSLEETNRAWIQANDRANGLAAALDRVQAELEASEEQVQQLVTERDDAVARAEKAGAVARENESRRVDVEKRLTVAQAGLSIAQEQVRAAQGDTGTAQSEARFAQARYHEALETAASAQQQAERASELVILIQGTASREVEKARNEANVRIEQLEKRAMLAEERAALADASVTEAQAVLVNALKGKEEALERQAEAEKRAAAAEESEAVFRTKLLESQAMYALSMFQKVRPPRFKGQLANLFQLPNPDDKTNKPR